MSIATRVARSAKPRRGGMSSRSLGHSRWSVGPKSPIMPLRRSGGGNPKLETRNKSKLMGMGQWANGRPRRFFAGGENSRAGNLTAETR